MNAISPLRLPEGLHPNVPEALYHSDPAAEPSASSSILKAIITKSPDHARDKHPRLNPAMEPSKSSDAKDWGTILHSLMLRTPAPFKACQFDSWRGKNADVRDEIRNAGLIPILTHKLAEIYEVADAVSKRIENEFPDFHAALNDPETITEATIICRINDVLCRIRVDVLPPARYGFIGDFKFTGLDAPPDEFAKTLKREYRVQSDLYPRAVQAVRGDLPEFRFYACEESSPFGVSCHTFGPGARARNRSRVNGALAKWEACMKAQRWPGYSTMVQVVEDDTWEDTRDIERAMKHEAAAQVSTGLVSDLHRITANIESHPQ